MGYEKFPEDSAVPNYPKVLNPKYFSIYCSLVNQAIIDSLKNKFNDEIFGKQAKKLYDKFLSEKKIRNNRGGIKIITNIL